MRDDLLLKLGAIVLLCNPLISAVCEETRSLLGDGDVKSYNLVRFYDNVALKGAVVLTHQRRSLDTPIFLHKESRRERVILFDHECLSEFHDPKRKVSLYCWREGAACGEAYQNYHCDLFKGAHFVQNCLEHQGFSYDLSLYDVARMAFLRSVKVNGEVVPFFYSPELEAFLRKSYQMLCLSAPWKNCFPEGERLFSEDFSQDFFFPEGYTRRWSFGFVCQTWKPGDVKIVIGDMCLKGELVPEVAQIDPTVDRGEVFFTMLSALQRPCSAAQKELAWRKSFSQRRQTYQRY